MTDHALSNCANCRNASVPFCDTHPLNWGIVKVMNLSAMRGGLSWSNIIEREEKQMLSQMTETQRKKHEADNADKMEAEEKRFIQSIKTYEVDKRKKLYTTQEGVAKRKFNFPCKKQHYDGGCWLHAEKHGACSFVHADEEELYTKIFSEHKIQGFYNADPLLRKTSDVKEGRCLWVTGVDKTGNLIFSKTNTEEQPMIKQPFRGFTKEQNSNAVCAW